MPTTHPRLLVTVASLTDIVERLRVPRRAAFETSCLRTVMVFWRQREHRNKSDNLHTLMPTANKWRPLPDLAEVVQDQECEVGLWE